MTCIEMPPHPGLDAFNQIKGLPGQFQSILNPVSGIMDSMNVIQNQENLDGKMKNMHGILDEIMSKKDGNAPNRFDFLKTSKPFNDARQFVNGMKLPFESLQQPPSIFNIFESLGGSGPVVSKVSDFFGAIKLGGDGCEKDEMKDAVETLEDIIDLADEVEKAKKDKVMDDLVKFWKDSVEYAKELKKVDKAMKKFAKEVEESEPDRKMFRQLDYMEPLLEKSIAGIEDLAGLNQIHELRNEVETVIKSEKTVTEVIKYVKDPTERIILDVVFKDFRKSAKNLTLITNKIEKLEKILLEMNQTNVINQTESHFSNESFGTREFIFVFIKAAELNFTETINLESYVESLKLLSNSTREKREIREVIEAYEKVYEATRIVNWNRIHMEFREMPEVVMQTKGEFSRMKVEEEPEDIWWIIWLIIGITCSLACSSCFILLFLWYRNRRDDDGTPYICPDELYKYSYVQMQDARLPMNAMDSKGQTDLYKAVLAKKWYKVKDLLENGALVDATCGPYLRTALFELVLMKDKEHAKDVLDAGAYILQPDVAGYYPEQYADEGGFMLLFDGYSKENQRKRVIPPNTPRPYKILVVDKDYIPRKERKNLPKRIRKKITWGYKESMDLDKFTHIVVPQKYSKKENILTLEDDDLFIWKCVASLANIMPESWIDAILRSDTYIEDDHVHMLIHMDYAENVHDEALLKLKTDLHMGRPKFLTHTSITILDTKDSKEAENKKEWEETMKSFGAEIVSKPKPDDDKTLLPYNSLYPYKDGSKKVQNSCWILKYEDSEIKPIWKTETEKYTLAPFRFVLECIARYQILPIGTTVIQMNEENGADGVEGTKSKEAVNDQTMTPTPNEPVTP